MVNNSPLTVTDEHINLIFHSLADPTRRHILEQLANRHLTVKKLAEPYHMSPPAISKHLKVLEHADLISRSRRGREFEIRLKPGALKTVAEYIEFYERFWTHRLDNLETFLKKGTS